MKTNLFTFLKFLAAFTTLLFAVGCPSISPDDNPYNFSKEYWGEWLRMDTDEIWYITANSISVNEKKLTQAVSLTKQSGRVIEVSESGRKYYLFASRSAIASFSGSIAGFSSPAAGRALSGLGGINVTIGNLKNTVDKSKVNTSADGSYTVNDVISGDEYRIEADGQTAVVIPYNDGDDVGILTITDGVNFKSRLIPKNQELDMRRLYADLTTYEFTLEIANNGNEDCTAAVYSLDFDDDLIVSGTVVASDRLGTIEPGRSKKMDIVLACKTIHAAWENKKIGIRITDTIANKTWEDSVSIRFNKAPVHFVIRSEREINGIIISPNATATQFATFPDGSGYGAIASLPWSNQDYLVVFSGATADTESVYSLGVNTLPETNYQGFMELGRHEPNNTEGAATGIMTQDRITAYLHKNDIDYYKINLSQAPQTHPLSIIGMLCREMPDDDDAGSVYMDILLKNNTANNVKGTAVLRPDSDDISIESDTAQITGIGGGKYRTLQSADGGTPAETAYYAGSGFANLFKFTPYTGGGVYSFAITFSLDSGETWEEKFVAALADSSSAVGGVAGANVAEKLQFIAGQSRDNVEYRVMVRENETVYPQTVRSMGNNVTVTLRSASSGNVRTLSLGGNGSMLTVSGGVTLKLENIVLQGHGSNNSALVLVGQGGKLILNSNSKITMNTNTSSQKGGGVYVNGGILEMNEGCEIIGNRATSNGNGGGINVENNGSIAIYGGIISENRAEGSLPAGGGIFIEDNSTVTMMGGTISKNYCSYGGGGIWVRGNFNKRAASGSSTSGIIYGSSGENANTAASNDGHAVHRYYGSRKNRNSTLGYSDEISTASDAGWE